MVILRDFEDDFESYYLYVTLRSLSFKDQMKNLLWRIKYTTNITCGKINTLIWIGRTLTWTIMDYRPDYQRYLEQLND